MGQVGNARSARPVNDRQETLDASVLTKVQAACNYVNAEITRLRNQTLAIGLVSVVGALVLWIFAGAGDARVPLVLAAGASVLAFVRARTELASSYSRVAAKRIVAGLGRQLAYNPKSSLTRQHFAALDLFAERCERWSSRNEIAGRVRAVRYGLHRVQAAPKDRKAPFFDGIVIRIDFEESVPGHTVILPDRLGHTADIANSGTAARRKKKDLVMVKHPAFEKQFDTYSTDYYEARQLVTPKFMELVLDAATRLKTELRLCFLGRSLFITARAEALPFEATLFAARLTPHHAVGSLADLVKLAERLATLRA